MDENAFKHKKLAEVVQDSDRQCTDIPCCLGLLAVFVSQFALIAYAASNGARPELLWKGYDYKGNLCEDGYADGSLTAWPALDTEVQPSSVRLMVCVPSCAETTKAANNSLFEGGDYYASESFLGEYCVPSQPLNFSAYDDFTDAQAEWQRAVADLAVTKWLIVVSSFLCIALAFVYLRLVASIGRLLMWLTMVVIIAGGALLSALLIQHGAADLAEPENEDLGKIEVGCGAVVAFVVLAMLLALWFIRKRIATAIQMLDEASTAVRDMKTTLVFPAVYSLVGIGYLAFWVLVLLYIYSVQTEQEGDVPPSLVTLYRETTKFVYYRFDDAMQDAIVWHCLTLFFMVQVIIYFGFMVLAGAVADWYFSHWNAQKTHKVRGDGMAELSHSPLWESFVRVLRFHLGSLALGALIIALIRIVRAVVKYLEAKTKGAENPVTKLLFCAVECCLRCCQCVFDRISKEGFIITTVYGTAYCYSSFQALKLLLKNVGRAALVEGVSHWTELFGRMAIASLNTGVAVLAMLYLPYYQRAVSSVLFPAVVIFVISWMVASFFMMVLQVAVDTVFLCFLLDEEVHSVAKFASDRLQQLAVRAHDNYQRMSDGEDSPSKQRKGRTNSTNYNEEV